MPRPTSSTFMRNQVAAARRHSVALRMVSAVESPGWRERMACTGVEPDVFYGSANVEEARAICAKCPVTMSCLAFGEAMERGRPRARIFGVMGGLTAQERWDGRHAPESEARLCLV